MVTPRWSPARVDFAAGAVYVFSPTMYTGTPPATVLKGKIVDAATGTGIVGATVQVGALTATTTAGGAFSLAGVSAGAFTLTASATGYVAVTASGALVAGGNDIGTLSLNKPIASTTLSGKVTDVRSGRPLPARPCPCKACPPRRSPTAATRSPASPRPHLT